MDSMGRTIGKELLVVGLLLQAGAAVAEEVEDGFKAFWKDFKAAVSKPDQKAVSKMVRYPIYYEGKRQAADFPLIWNASFKPAQRTCLTRQKPVKDDAGGAKVTYSAFCGQLIYVFGKDDAGWKLTDFGAND